MVTGIEIPFVDSRFKWTINPGKGGTVVLMLFGRISIILTMFTKA